MKKIWIAVLIVSLFQGCATPIKEESKSGVDERAASPAATTQPATGPAVTAQPIARSEDSQANPLRDPSNALSKRSVFFEFDKYDVKDEYRPLLQSHGKYLASHRDAKMLVQGNCDERGSREYNIALGQRRADSVKKMLVLMGATDAQVEAVSLGEEKPRCAEHGEQCWAQNRRGDILYSGEF